MPKTWTVEMTVTENPQTTQPAVSNEDAAKLASKADVSTLVKTVAEDLRGKGYSVTGTYRLDQGDNVPL